MSLTALLRASDVLADLTSDELDAFAALGQSRHVAPGTLIQAMGEPWLGLCLLQEGALRKSDAYNDIQHVPRGTLLEWSAALSNRPSEARYAAPWGGAQVIVWPHEVVNAFFNDRPHLLGLLHQRVDALAPPRLHVPAPSDAVVPLHIASPPRRKTASLRRLLMRWRLQSGDQKLASIAALVALTLAQWMPMVYMRFVVGTALVRRHHTHVWMLGLACAWALGTIMSMTPWRRRDNDAPARQVLRLWLLNLGIFLCSTWLAITAWPLALILCCGQLVCCVCALRLLALRNHRHPTYIVLQSRQLNFRTNRWRNASRLANLMTCGLLILAGAHGLQKGQMAMGDLIAAIFLAMMMQHAWRESFVHTLIVDGAASPPMVAHQASITAEPDLHIAPGQRLGVVGSSGSGLSWTAASAAHCVALLDAIVPVHAPLRDGLLLNFFGLAPDLEALQQALAWTGADRCVDKLKDGLGTYVTRFDPRLSMQERVCLHAARLILESPAGLVFDACLDLVDPTLAQVLLTNLACALPHTRVGIVSHQADILRRCHRVALLAPHQALQQGDFYGLWTRGQLTPFTYISHA